MTISITFPTADVKSFDAPPTGLQIAQGISPSLAKKAALVKVNGELWDLTGRSTTKRPIRDRHP